MVRTRVGALFLGLLWLPLLAQDGWGKLPPLLQEQGRAVLAEADDAKRASLASELARKDAAGSAEFLLALLETERSSRVREAILNRIGGLNHPGVRQTLVRMAASDPDPRLSLLALERIRNTAAQRTLRLLDQRMKLARETGDQVQIQFLAKEQERWVVHARGSRLPGFFHTPPAVFSVRPEGGAVRVLAFGDYGQEAPFQKQASAAMLAYHRRTPFDFAITLGDNFYPRGMESPSDPRWKRLWDQHYDPLGIPFYISLGNHDWGLPDSPAAEVMYSAKSPSWRLPATRYSFTAGAAQFFAIDSQTPSEAQWMWLHDELGRSTARWKIVYGHHPVYSHGVHGDTPRLITELLPVLKDRADAYFAGHEHDMQHLKPEGGVHLFIAGSGGAGIRRITPGPRSLFAKSSYGFAVIEADQASLKVTFVNTDLEPLYEYTLRK